MEIHLKHALLAMEGKPTAAAIYATDVKEPAKRLPWLVQGQEFFMQSGTIISPLPSPFASLDCRAHVALPPLSC